MICEHKNQWKASDLHAAPMVDGKFVFYGWCPECGAVRKCDTVGRLHWVSPAGFDIELNKETRTNATDLADVVDRMGDVIKKMTTIIIKHGER